MGRFSRGADGPRVVGFDFRPPAAVPSYEPPVEFAPPAAEAPPPAPLYPPPAYPPPPAMEPSPYAPPVATLPPPAPLEGGWATAPFPPPPAWLPAPPPKRGNGVKIAVIVSGAVAATMVAAALFGLDSVRRTMPGGKRIPKGVTLHTPERIGGAELMTSPFAKQVVAESMKDTVSLQQAQVGLYGNDSVPRYFLFAGFSPERTNGEVFEEFSQGFLGESDMGSVGKPKPMPGDVLCAPVTVGPLEGSACAWASDRSNGVLMDYQERDVTRLAKLAVRARADVNGT